MAASPHPDIAAIKSVLDQNKNYETFVVFADKFNRSPREFDLAVLHGLPSRKNNVESTVSQLKAAQIPIWFILSSQSSVNDFNKAQNLVTISGGSNNTNDAKAIPAGGFNLFNLENNVSQQVAEFPPLTVPFGEYKSSPTTQVLFKQKIGTVDTEYPLLNIEQSTGYKMAVLCGEGLWRWRMYDYKTDKQHETTNELVSKVIQYLSVKNDKRKFRVDMSKNLFYETEKITFNAELYNDSYELINGPEASITIYDEAGKAFPFVFNKTASAYELDAGFFPVGKYTYAAKTNHNGKEYKTNGSFSVAPVQLETMQTTARHDLLYAMTKRVEGDLVFPDSLLTLIDKIKNNPPAAIQYSSFKTQSIINLKWLFFLLIALLTIEWFVRKLIGGY